jgi:hypothetical protein
MPIQQSNMFSTASRLLEGKLQVVLSPSVDSAVSTPRLSMQVDSTLAHTHSLNSCAFGFVHDDVSVGHDPLHIVQDYVDVGERVAFDGD